MFCFANKELDTDMKIHASSYNTKPRNVHELVTSTSFAFKTFFQILSTQKHCTHLVSRINKKAPLPLKWINKLFSIASLVTVATFKA